LGGEPERKASAGGKEKEKESARGRLFPFTPRSVRGRKGTKEAPDLEEEKK